TSHRVADELPVALDRPGRRSQAEKDTPAITCHRYLLHLGISTILRLKATPEVCDRTGSLDPHVRHCHQREGCFHTDAHKPTGASDGMALQVQSDIARLNPNAIPRTGT